MCDESCFVEVLARLGLDECRDRFAEALIGNADHSSIGDRRMCLQDFFHFLGVHLLAAGVNALTSTAEQLH